MTTYELTEDTNATDKKKYYIRSAYPSCYRTDNMMKRETNNVAKALRQLGYTVIDLTK